MLGLTPKDNISRTVPCEHRDQVVKDRVRDEADPSAIHNDLWLGESRLRDHSGRQSDVSKIIIVHRRNNGRVDDLYTGGTTEQAQIAQSLRESHDELRRLSGLLITIQEGERRRIAMDLHDGLGQSLSLIKLSIEGAVRLLAAGATGEVGESLQQLIPRVREAMAEVRRVSTELRPWILDDLGIVRTLSWFFREFEAARGDITVEQAINVAEHEVPVPLQITIYRILQEATNNIVKHAGANRVRVTLDRVDDVLNLVIEDDGCGFNPDSIPCVECQSRGFGLVSMKERASFSGGTYQLSTSPGQGTRIEVCWPCGELPG